MKLLHIFLFLSTISLATLANGFIPAALAADFQDSLHTSVTDYEKEMMAKRKTFVHMGVVPRRAFRGSLVRRIGMFWYPFLLSWIIVNDSFSVLLDQRSMAAQRSPAFLGDGARSMAELYHALSGVVEGTRTAGLATVSGLLNSLAAAIVLSDNLNRTAKYFYFTAPWWVRNRLRPQNGMDADLAFFRLITADRTLLDFIESHMLVRYEARDFLEAQKADEVLLGKATSRRTTISELSVAGGSIITQYVLFGDEIYQFPEDHELVSAGAHILDDFNDESQDKILGNLNHFIHHLGPNATEFDKCKHAEEWVKVMYNVHTRHAKTPFGRFIRGTMFYLCNAEDRLRGVVEDMNDREAVDKCIPLPKLTWNDIEW